MAARKKTTKRRSLNWVTKSIRELFSWYTVQGATIISAVSTAYAASADLQRLIPATKFASVIAVAGLVLIVLRNIKQSGD